ncbi:MAG: PilZ domain-containing protein [Deltaproteobacteria bacterium]|nr:PilZ domain-containing protein [Deltaproteobacteria bacterium]MCW5805595.1 PilZ domain-containing protein [Deltaproteobacteria bacterium]
MGIQPKGERRRAMRVPVRGVAVFTGGVHGPIHGVVENLSQTGALINFPTQFDGGSADFDIELRLAEGDGWVGARAVRREAAAKRWRVAVAFERVDAAMREAIDASIHAALAAARRRPVLVIDDQHERRASLIERLSDRGMTPLAPRTPLEAIDLLTRAQLHVNVCLLAPGFGVPSHDLAAVLSDSFPWVTTTMISDDLDATAHRAVAAWSETPVARLGAAIG